MVVPTDPMYDDHWGHNNTAQLPGLDWGGTYDHTLPTTVGTPGFDANAQVAWDGTQGFGSASIIVAIIDTGVDIDHPDLSVVTGYDYGDNDSNPDDNSAAAGHGTCCAGVAAAKVNNGLGACGAAPACKIMPLKVANSAGSMYFSAIVNAIYYAADHGAHIISMSLGAAISSDPSTDAAIQYAYNAGVTILAATGNENKSTISYPAINTYVVGVGAASPCGDRKRSSSLSSECNPGVSTDPNGYTCDGERWWGSNYGTNTKDAAGAVDVLGPTILPTSDIVGSGGYRSGDYEPFFNGTSCATPYVAGVCALIKSKNPSWTPSQIRTQLVNTAIDIVNVESGTGWDRRAGYGMVDAAAAVGGGGGPVAPVAAFTGTPTSGTAPLTVNFTDQSTGSPTSWSWDFGDLGTSTAQNPAHTYTNPGTYTVSLTATNSVGSDNETKTNYITVNAPSAWTTITYDNFETGWGSYTDGGADCSRYTGGTYAWEGSAAIDIQDNSGTPSSFYHTGTYNVTSYNTLEVEFYFIAVSMESGEDFWVQYYNGSSWVTVATYARGTSFNNNTWYMATVRIARSSYNFPTNARIRFRCDASNDQDDVYIDAVTFRGTAAVNPTSVALSAQRGNDRIIPNLLSDESPEVESTSLLQNYPNPFNPTTRISFTLVEASNVRLEVFNVAGQRVALLVNEHREAGLHFVDFDASALSSGIYFYRLTAGDVTQNRKMILLK
jgi:subtilisin family serine protease